MLTLNDLYIRQGSFELRSDLTIQRGGRIAVIGPSGAGKSTLLGAIAGFVPCQGSIHCNDLDLTTLPTAERKLSMIFQDNNLFPHMTATQNIGVGLRPNLRLSGDEKDMVAGALDRVGLTGMGDRKPSQLSGGQQSRVALARTLVQKNPLILLDEPFAALGPALRDEMLDLVDELAEELGATLLMVTHTPQDAVRIADGVIVVADGQAHAPIPTSDFIANPPAALKDYLT